jgi:hypothetical protein
MSPALSTANHGGSIVIARSLLCVFALAIGAVPQALAQEPAAPQEPAPQEESCKCRPQRVGPCFTVRGAVTLYPRPPIVRIVVTGTKRVLGLEGGVPEFLEEDLEGAPAVVTGDFLVCPITRPKTGTIQLVCVDSAANMVVTEKR